MEQEKILRVDDSICIEFQHGGALGRVVNIEGETVYIQDMSIPLHRIYKTSRENIRKTIYKRLQWKVDAENLRQ